MIIDNCSNAPLRECSHEWQRKNNNNLLWWYASLIALSAFITEQSIFFNDTYKARALADPYVLSFVYIPEEKKKKREFLDVTAISLREKQCGLSFCSHMSDNTALYNQKSISICMCAQVLFYYTKQSHAMLVINCALCFRWINRQRQHEWRYYGEWEGDQWRKVSSDGKGLLKM